MVGRWSTRLCSSLALFGLNVMHPGRDTQGLRPILEDAATIFVLLFGLFGFCSLALRLFVVLCCSPTLNPPELVNEGIPFRYYRGKSWYRCRKRVPTYHTRNRQGRKAALRFMKGLAEPKQPDHEPRRLRRERQKAKRKPQQWNHLSPAEEAADKADKFERMKTRFIHNSFVMYELQYGVNLDQFVDSIDPLKSFILHKTISREDYIETSSSRRQREKARAQSTFVRAVRREALHYCFSQAELWKLKWAVLRKKLRATGLIPQFRVREFIRPRANVCSAQIGSTHEHSVYLSSDSSNYPIVIDSGASFSLTPNIEDFITPLTPVNVKLTNLDGETPVAGVGTVEWVIRDVNGKVHTIRCEAFYVPKAQIRLYSPQQYFMEHGEGHLFMDKDKTVLTLPGGNMEFPYNCCSRLPMMLLDNEHFREERSAGFTETHVKYLATATFPSIVDMTNLNLTSSQKELLLWHWKLGHANMHWIQSLAAKPRSDDMPHNRPILPTRAGSRMSSCERPLCTACQLAKQSRRTRAGAKQKTGDQGAAIRANDLRPGDCVSIDQYQSGFPGRLEKSKGKEPKKLQRTGGTIFVDHATGLTYVVHQVSLTVAETIKAKRQFEAFAKDHGVVVKSYRADNVPFGLQAFKDEIAACHQTIDFSGVGAHHQNGVAERAIGTITRFARAMMLQQAMLWPDRADLRHWPFAMDHAVFLWNNLPREGTRLAPLEMFTGVTRQDFTPIEKAHVWGCPVYVLDPKLQDGKKLPKWDPRARRGMYLGVSAAHSSSSIARVLNLRTGHISPQFHMVFDDKFTTINNQESAGLVDPARFDADHWERVIESGYEMYLDPDEPELPDLDDSWLTPHERRIRLER